MTLREVLNVINGSRLVSIYHNNRFVGTFKKNVALSYLDPVILTYAVEGLATTYLTDAICIYLISQE